MEIRPAHLDDLPEIMTILNREITEGVAHFGLAPQVLEQVSGEFSSAVGVYPWHVAIDEEGVLGFARASPWKSRGAYAKTVEVGVYIKPDLQGKKVGTRLYEIFLPAVFEAGYHCLLAGIRLPNDPCVRLHERFGFRHVGTLPEVGFKFGEWHDVGYWALTAAGESESR